MIRNVSLRFWGSSTSTVKRWSFSPFSTVLSVQKLPFVLHTFLESPRMSIGGTFHLLGRDFDRCLPTEYLLFDIFFATTSGSDETSKVSGSGGNFEVEVLEVFRCLIDHFWLND
jgi:hypothetical protein